MSETIYEVCWEGPYAKDDIVSKLAGNENRYGLYSVYGSHPVYGDNILLYIGMTERGVLKRLSEHDYWMDQERFGPSRIFVASIGPFVSWEESNEIDVFELPSRDVIERVEQLLIYANGPVHNSKARKSARSASGIRIFNTNNYGSLIPEVSSLYYWC